MSQRYSTVQAGVKAGLADLLNKVPEERFKIPAIVAAHIEAGRGYAWASAFGSQIANLSQVLQSLVERYNSMINQAVEPLTAPVTFNHVLVAVGPPVQIRVDVSNGATTKQFSYTFTGTAVSGDTWASRVDAGKALYSAYANSVTPVEVEQILDAAASGYKAFITPNPAQATPDQLLAQLLQEIRVRGVDPGAYINALRDGATVGPDGESRYSRNAKAKKAKWGEAFGLVTATATQFAHGVARAYLALKAGV